MVVVFPWTWILAAPSGGLVRLRFYAGVEVSLAFNGQSYISGSEADALFSQANARDSPLGRKLEDVASSDVVV